MKYIDKKDLKCDFPKDALLELQYNDSNTWLRATINEFRSFNGKRRYHNIISGRDPSKIARTTHYYDGPIYYYGTNKVIENTNENHIIGEIFNSESKSGRI